ncbi:MAG: Gfo/Idh/MocA family oxidoreductase [Planctomycetes bacterium]|jgi:predicted dehydrogenase|nr:Gfo/Idh/MocA family oxidoreductase [Planctomycetota bacterium]
MPKPLNVALIGSKFMGRTHSNAYMKVGKFFDLPRQPVMHTIAARDEADLKQFAPRWGWNQYTTRWQDVCESDEIELIDIGVPNHMHREMAVAALEAGKHVACEKPLANTLDNAREMVEAAKKAGKRAKKQQTFVWYNYRRTPAVALAHQFARSGMLGKLYHVRCFYLQDWAGPDAPMLWRFQGDVAGSGSLGDLCAHSIDTARFITGDEISEINGAILKTFVKERAVLAGGAGGEISGGGAKTAKKKAKSTVDDAVLFTAEFKEGAVATFEATRLSTGDKNGNRIEVHGEKGAIKFDFEHMTKLEWYDNTLPARQQGWSTIDVSNGGAGHPYGDVWWPTAHPIGYEHTFINQAADMVKALAGRKPEVPLCDFNDAYQTQRVLEAVTQSAKNRCPIKLSQIK